MRDLVGVSYRARVSDGTRGYVAMSPLTGDRERQMATARIGANFIQVGEDDAVNQPMHELEIEKERTLLITLLEPLRVSPNQCACINVDLIYPRSRIPTTGMRNQQWDSEQLRDRFKADVNTVMAETVRPTYVTCGYRTGYASHAWFLLIDESNHMYAFDTGADELRHPLDAGRTIRTMMSTFHEQHYSYCTFNWNRFLDESCGLYGACQWGAFAAAFYAASCPDLISLLCKRPLSTQLIPELLEYVNRHVTLLATPAIAIEMQNKLLTHVTSTPP